MLTAIRFALVGFVAGIAVALALTAISMQQTLPPQEMHVLWPTSVLGLDFSGWADGNAGDFLLLLFIFVGNGLLYSVIAGLFGGLVGALRRLH